MTASWKWRWLLTIPKTPVENPSPTDFRALMLSEVLRKLMSTNLVDKILDVIHKRRALDSANQGYTRGKGVKNALIQVINHRDDAQEKQTPLHQ